MPTPGWPRETKEALAQRVVSILREFAPRGEWGEGAEPFIVHSQDPRDERWFTGVPFVMLDSLNPENPDNVAIRKLTGLSQADLNALIDEVDKAYASLDPARG